MALVGGENASGPAGSDRHGIRLMLVRTHGCRICMALDAVEGVFCLDNASPTLTLPQGTMVPLVDWSQVTGVDVAANGDATQVMVVRTPNGLVGLRIESCLGVRSVSFARTPPMPTRLVDASGSPLCFLLMLDGRPHLMLEPRGLTARIGSPTTSTVAGQAEQQGNGMKRPTSPEAQPA